MYLLRDSCWRLFAECQEHNSKQDRRLVFEELILCCKKSGWWSGMNWEKGVDRHPLVILCIKQVTSENLPYSTGNSI